MHQKTQSHFLKIFIHLSVRSPGKNYRQIYGKSKASFWKNLSTDTPPKFFCKILCFVASVNNLYFFRKAVMRKLFDIRFSYKHGNFSRVCLLVKMASKTVTRSIPVTLSVVQVVQGAWVKCQVHFSATNALLSVLQVAPLVGIQFVTYEITKALLYGEGLQLPFRK